MADERVVVDERAIGDITGSLDVLDLLLEVAEPIIDRARAGAPKRSGQGAASIHGEPVLDGPDWTVRISWDRDHFYMGFFEFGTEHIIARPFLEPALEGF
jgi:HK97 gp10 family phage protein